MTQTITIPQRCLESEDLHAKWLEYLERVFGKIISIKQTGTELTINFEK